MSKIMADRPTLVKMAVSDNPDLKDSMARDEYEQRPNPFNSRPNFDVIPKKKGTFKITSVKLNDTGDADSMDDLDESHTEMTEDYSSEILDTSRATDYGQETPSATEDIPLTSQTIRIVNDSKEKTGTDMHSRFRVVKIETNEPFHRGRWVCHDFLDPQPSVNTEKSETKVYDEANSGSSSAGSSIHYVHGVDDPAKNPLLAGATGTVYLPTLVPESQVVGNQDNFQPIHPAPSTVGTVMQNNTQSQISSIGYFSDSSQGQGALCQTVNQSHSHQSINSMSSIDTIQSMTPQVISGHSNQGEFHSGQVPPSQPMVNHTQTDSSKVPGMQHNPGVYLPHFSSGPQGTPGILPGSSMSMQSGYTPSNLVSSNISEMIPHDQVASTVNNQSQATSTYQTYVHLSQQIVNPSIAQSGHSESVPGSVVKDLQATLNVPEDVSVSVSKPDASPTPPSDLKGALDKDLNEIQSPTALSPALAAAVGDLNAQTPQEEDDGGSSTVAIDNKIEQAMDLVKSHLMFAVREEVEVLKEQIKELMERTGQLEYENGILRAAASPETLAQLAQPRQQPPSSSS